MTSIFLNANVFRNFLGGFLVAYGWVAFFCFFGLISYWAGTAPPVPDQAHGLVFPHNEHGNMTYFSAFQATSGAILFATSIPLFFIGILIAPKKNILSKSGKFWFHATWNADDPLKISRWGMCAGAAFAPLFIFSLGQALVSQLNAWGLVISF